MTIFKIEHQAINKPLASYLVLDGNRYTIQKGLETAYKVLSVRVASDLQDAEIKRAFAEVIDTLAQYPDDTPLDYFAVQYDVPQNVHLLLGFNSVEEYIVRRDKIVIESIAERKAALKKQEEIPAAQPIPAQQPQPTQEESDAGSPARFQFLPLSPKDTESLEKQDKQDKPNKHLGPEPLSLTNRIIIAIVGFILESLALISGVNVYRFIHAYFSNPDIVHPKNKHLFYPGFMVIGMITPLILAARLIINFWDNLTEDDPENLPSILCEMSDDEDAGSYQGFYDNTLTFFSVFMTISMLAVTTLALSTVGVFTFDIGLNLIPEMGRAILAMPDLGGVSATLFSAVFIPVASLVTSLALSVAVIVSDFVADVFKRGGFSASGGPTIERLYKHDDNKWEQKAKAALARSDQFLKENDEVMITPRGTFYYKPQKPAVVSVVSELPQETQATNNPALFAAPQVLQAESPKQQEPLVDVVRQQARQYSNSDI